MPICLDNLQNLLALMKSRYKEEDELLSWDITGIKMVSCIF